VVSVVDATLAISLTQSTIRAPVFCPHSLVLLAMAVVAAPNSAALLAAESAVLAIVARADRLLATISQAIPMPIKRSGMGF
jgi:uncharacterized membrane protein YhhN